MGVGRLGCLVVVAIGPTACAAETAPMSDVVSGSDLGESSTAILAPQRDASAYTEAVLVEVNNVDQHYCSGVLVAPRVVLTAAHCTVFNPDNDGNGARGTWTIRVPFATTGPQTITASSGEPLDPAFYAVSVADYDSHAELHDIAFLYLDTPVTGVTFPTFSATRYPVGATTVSAVGRDTNSRTAGLALSKAVALSATTGADGYPNDNRTPRVTAGGDSGGPLFIEGTHTLVGLETRFTGSASTGRDYWVRLDEIHPYIQAFVAAHAGARDVVYDFHTQLAALLCGRAAACCLATDPGYLLDPMACRAIYGDLGFEATARDLLAANRSNVTIDPTSRSACLVAAGNTSACTLGSAATKANITSCIAAAVGLAPAGGACASSVECAGNRVCERRADGSGTCQALHASGSSCEVAYKGLSLDERYDVAQDLCSKRGGGSPALYCDGFDFAANAYKDEATWTCQPAKANGAPCGTNPECASSICAPFGAANQFTCVASTSYVTAAVCAAFE